MSYAFGDKLGIGQLPPPHLYGAGHLWFNEADIKFYYHTGIDWEILGVDPTVSNFDVYDDLRNAHTPGSPIILVGGRSAAGDGGQGFFIRDPSNRADNDGTILVDADGQSWQRVFTGDVLAVWFFGNGATINRSQFMGLYDTVYNDHGLYTVDWVSVILQDSASTNVTLSFDRTHIIKNLTVQFNPGALTFSADAPATAGEHVQVEFVGCTFGGQVHFTTTSGAASNYVHDSVFNHCVVWIEGDAVVADSIGINTRFNTYDNAVLRNSVARTYQGATVHQFRGNSFVFGNQFYNIEPTWGATAEISDATRVVNNTFWTHVPSGVANGGVNIGSVDGAIVANNRVYLRRFTYPYPMSINNPHKVTVFGNYVESHTDGGQDSTQWRFSVDADSVLVSGNAFVVRGGSGNYGVRIRGGAKANAIAANNMFMNFGSHGGNGIERRDGTGNLKFVANTFYNWGYAIRKIGTDAINGVFEGNSNAFSNCGPINDPDYTNTTADTVWS